MLGKALSEEGPRFPGSAQESSVLGVLFLPPNAISPSTCGMGGGVEGAFPWEEGNLECDSSTRNRKQNQAEQPALVRDALAGRTPAARPLQGGSGPAAGWLVPVTRKSGQHLAGKRPSGSQVGPWSESICSESILGNRNCLKGTDFSLCVTQPW